MKLLMKAQNFAIYAFQKKKLTERETSTTSTTLNTEKYRYKRC